MATRKRLLSRKRRSSPSYRGLRPRRQGQFRDSNSGTPEPRNLGTIDGEWRAYRGDYRNHHRSPLAQMVNGKQYITVAVSGGNYSGEYLAFTLPGS